jgi:glycosyltransferase involved in cell wall biosynthesis
VRVLIDYRPALRNRSGVGEYTHQLVKALAHRYHGPGINGDLAVTIFSSSWKDRLPPAAAPPGVATLDRRVPVRVLNFTWHRLEWPPIETLSGQAFDVTHSLHPLLLPAREAAQVITIHDLNFLAHPERTRGEIRRDYPALVRQHARRADRILVPSRFTAREVERQLGVDGARIAVCPPGAPDWAPRQNAAAGGYILFFGTLEPRKNVGGLLDAYEVLLGTHAAPPELVLAGKPTPEAEPWLERLRRPPLAGRVRHVGYVQPDDRQRLYAGARLLVMPSFEEGFGIPVLEAMTLGVPVVASARGSLPEVLADAGPLIDPGKPAEIAAAIHRVLEEPGYAAGCAARGVVQARQFNWHRTAGLVYEAYQQAVAGRRARQPHAR